MNIGIIGIGVVGKAVKAYHDSRGDEVWTYDIATDRQDALETLDKKSKVIFICVGTPLGVDCKLDCSAVYDAVSNIKRPHTIIIKSTVMPGTTDTLQEQYPQHRMFFIPEFLDADTAVGDYAKPKRGNVIGVAGRRKIHLHWRVLFDRLLPGYATERSKDAVIWPMARTIDRVDNLFMPAREAELLKLATNTFYAFRVIFANMLYDLGMSQSGINAVFANPRIGDWGCQILHKGYRGASGACLSKDPIAFATFLNGNTDKAARILDSALDYNKHLVDSTKQD
jgi:UDPglucose 6-dehydrogenase